jgi:glycolate oxidase iron-sulfur subunit
MQTNLADFIKGTREGEEAEAILRACVHCGFCTATCPTYQLLGDELDGPRGRIYLIKQVLEGVARPARPNCTWTAASPAATAKAPARPA